MAEYRNSPGMEPVDPRDAELASLRAGLAERVRFADAATMQNNALHEECDSLRAEIVNVRAMFDVTRARVAKAGGFDATLGWLHQESEVASLRAEVERLKAEHAQVAGALGCVHEQSMGECHAGTVDDVLCAIAALKARPVGVPAEVRAALIHAVDPEFNGGADAAKARAWLASTADGATSERDGAK